MIQVLRFFENDENSYLEDINKLKERNQKKKGTEKGGRCSMYCFA